MPNPRYYPETDPELEGKTPDILVIEALQDGPRTRRQVIQYLKRETPEFFRPRSAKTYDDWTDRVVWYGFVDTRGTTLRLSKVGEWVVKSHQGTISQRIQFAKDIVCEECRRSRHSIVLVRCDLRCAKKDGSFTVDGICPECGLRPGSTPESPEWCNIGTDLFSAYAEFDCMYQVAKKELMGSLE